jgi:hypothetical protein
LDSFTTLISSTRSGMLMIIVDEKAYLRPNGRFSSTGRGQQIV